jgi:hypothetical protein
MMGSSVKSKMFSNALQVILKLLKINDFKYNLNISLYENHRLILFGGFLSFYVFNFIDIMWLIYCFSFFFVILKL